jgi:hypothetical protein
MKGGFKAGDKASDDEAVDFETGDIAEAAPANRQETYAERRRREHEDYKKKKEADPAFIPNRGAFFMHDQRSASGPNNGFRPFGRGQARTRGGGPGVGPSPSNK